MYNKEKNKNPVILGRGELQKLRANADSCVEVKTCAHHITLHPFHLSNLQNSIKDILGKGIARYSNKFEGILLGYENIKLFGHQAPMFDDMCYMHKTIEADFYIFKPTIGCTLNGIINKKSQDHIGCLVHKLFNISLPKPKDSEDWLGSKAQIGQEVQFKVSYMNLESRLPYIRGDILAILSEDSGISTSDEIVAPRKNKITKFIDDEGDVPQPTAEPAKKKKSKKKKKCVDAEEIDADTFISKTKKSKTKNQKKSKVKEVLSQENKESMVTNDRATIIEDLKGKYLEQLSRLKRIADADSADVASAPKKKKKVKQEKEEGTNENSEECSKKKKTKIAKVKIDEKERDLLDQTLPDLKLDELFSERSPPERKPEDLKVSQNIVLPADSDLDEVLKDFPKINKKEKLLPKKRKLDEMAEGLEASFRGASKKKKKRKST